LTRPEPSPDTLYQRRYNKAHPEKVAEGKRRFKAARPRYFTENHRLRKYGVTPEWFRDQLVGQAGRCAICGFVFPSDRDTCVDHDHKTNLPRALLCRDCNLMIGHAHESTRTLQTAISYLARSL